MLTCGGDRSALSAAIVSDNSPPNDLFELTQILLSGSVEATHDRIDQLLDTGISLPNVLLEVLTPIAQRLGEMWVEDECTFADVTIAVGRLQQVLRHYAALFDAEPRQARAHRRILLTGAAHDTHSFGLSMLDLFFRQSGWEVTFEPGRGLTTAIAKVKKIAFEVVAVSIGSDTLLAQVSCDIKTLRRTSRNRSLIVLVGGAALIGHPERVALLGADGTASNGADAVNCAERLVRHNSYA
jgi:methanogenic corrinoid protein MtbC1